MQIKRRSFLQALGIGSLLSQVDIPTSNSRAIEPIPVPIPPDNWVRLHNEDMEEIKAIAQLRTDGPQSGRAILAMNQGARSDHPMFKGGNMKWNGVEVMHGAKVIFDPSKSDGVIVFDTTESLSESKL